MKVSFVFSICYRFREKNTKLTFTKKNIHLRGCNQFTPSFCNINFSISVSDLTPEIGCYSKTGTSNKKSLGEEGSNLKQTFQTLIRWRFVKLELLLNFFAAGSPMDQFILLISQMKFILWNVKSEYYLYQTPVFILSTCF